MGLEDKLRPRAESISGSEEDDREANFRMREGAVLCVAGSASHGLLGCEHAAPILQRCDRESQRNSLLLQTAASGKLLFKASFPC